MKYREMLLRDKPGLVDKLFRGGCSGCPCDYGYEEGYWCKGNPRLSCDDCWDREGKEMRERVNDCVDCGYDNCSGCPMRDREILCCDYCGKELENGYEYKGDVYCASCLLRQLWEDDVINKIS